MNVTNCDGLDSPGAWLPKSSSGVEGSRELSPTPDIGTAKDLSVSALVGLVMVSTALSAGGDGTVAGRKGGHCDGAADDGSHGQLCCGENETVIVQLCCGARENDDPGDVVQLSCSVKLGSPSKSLNGKLLLPG